MKSHARGARKAAYTCGLICAAFVVLIGMALAIYVFVMPGLVSVRACGIAPYAAAGLHVVDGYRDDAGQDYSVAQIMNVDPWVYELILKQSSDSDYWHNEPIPRAILDSDIKQAAGAAADLPHDYMERAQAICAAGDPVLWYRDFEPGNKAVLLILARRADGSCEGVFFKTKY